MDLVLTLIVPVLLVTVLMLATLLAVIQAMERKKRLAESLLKCDALHSKTVEVKVARFLTIVSLTLIFLHSPSHVIRLRMLIASFVYTDEPSQLDYSLQRAFEIMYYLNFSANLLIYVSAGDKFRTTLLQTLSMKYCKDTSSLKIGEQKCTTNVVKQDMELTTAKTAFDNISFCSEDDVKGLKQQPVYTRSVTAIR